MRRRTLVFVLTAIALVTAACTGGIERAADVLQTRSATPSVTASPPLTVSASPTPDPIVVRTPRADDDVLSPVLVSGTATSTTGELVVDVLDAQGMELAAMNVRIDCGAACRGGFRARLAFYVPIRQPGTIEVYEVGPGGSAVHLVEVGVTLVPGV